MKPYKPQFVALVILAFFASVYVANLGLLLQKPIWQESVRTYKFTPEPGHDVEIIVGGSGDTQTVQESFYYVGNTTWKAPAGVTSISVELWGGGGAGGGLTTDNTICRGGGGAGGQYVSSSSVPVTPGTNYTITIGAGGTSSTGNGNPGGDTTFNSTVMIAKGAPGGLSYENGATAGLGTTTGAVGGNIVYPGGNGSNGGTGTTGGAGGSGAADTGTGNNASGNTAGAFKLFGGGIGAAGLTSSNAGNRQNSVIGGIGPTYLARGSFTSTGGNNPNLGYGGGGGAGANTVNTLTTNRNGGSGAPGGVKITFTTNIAYLSFSGLIAEASAVSQPNYPAYSTSTDLLIAVVVYKHASSTLTTPAGWTQIADIEGGHRPSYLTADQGAVRTQVYAREATSSLTSTASFSVGSPTGDNVTSQIYRFVKSPGTTWYYATSTGIDSTVNTSWVVTSTAMSIQPDDMIFTVSGINGDAASFSSQSFSAITGITFGEVTGEMMDYASTSGLDTRLVTYMARVYSGTTTTAPIVFNMTASATSTNRPLGSTVFIVIRQTAGGTIPVQVQDVIFFD